MPYLKLIFGFFLFFIISLAFLFSPATVKISEAHPIYCGVPPEPGYVLDNRFQEHTGPIPHHPATVTTTVSGTTVTVSWSPSTGCYGWYEQPADITTLPATSWHYIQATSATFTGSCGFTYQPSVMTVMNGDLTSAGFCCNIGHPSGWNHSVATTDVNFNNSGSTVGNSVTVSCAPPFSITSLSAGACDGGPTQPVTINWSGTPAGTTSFLIHRGIVSNSVSQIDTVSNGAATSYIDNGPARPPSAGTYYYFIQALPSFNNTGWPAPGVSVAACFDYSLTNNGNITASQGGAGSNIITANLTVAPTQAVSFSASGLPAGATPSFSPTSCNPTCSSTLTISTTASTPLGTYPITVTGSPLSRTTSFNLIVTGPPGPFSSNLVATPGCSGTTPIVNLTWGASSGAASYTILRDGLAIVIGWTGTSYLDNSGLVTGTLYTYQIQAVNSLGSLLSNTASATALNCANPTVNLRVGNADYASASEGPISIPSGSSSLLTWTSSNATSCNATGAWAVIGSKAIINTSPGESTGTLGLPGPHTSTLTCQNANVIPPTPVSRVFVTSTLYNGNLGGLAGADSQCQARATAAGLGGTWKAWLSDSSQSPSTRFTQSSGPYQLLNGITIANSWSDLTDGTIAAPINISELGTTPPNTVDICGMGLVGSNVYTGTTAQGTLFNPPTPMTCSNWSTSSNGSSSSFWALFGATVNTITAGWSEWTQMCYAGTANCSQSARLYCFEQVTPPPPLSISDSVIINIIQPLPWIQTTGGDVHSNVEINTPGGP